VSPECNSICKWLFLQLKTVCWIGHFLLCKCRKYALKVISLEIIFVKPIIRRHRRGKRGVKVYVKDVDLRGKKRWGFGVWKFPSHLLSLCFGYNCNLKFVYFSSNFLIFFELHKTIGGLQMSSIFPIFDWLLVLRKYFVLKQPCLADFYKFGTHL
jgi:hypothetical protein